MKMSFNKRAQLSHRTSATIITSKRKTNTLYSQPGWLTLAAALLLTLTSSLAVADEIPRGPLVSTTWLHDNLDHPQLRIVEVSVNPGVYERGHIPGAVNFSWHHDLNDQVQRDIVSPENFEKLLSRAGIGPDSTVILYGDTNNWFTAWGAWVFDIYGVPNVKLLDGGRKKWEAENLPLDTRTPEYVSTSFQVQQVNSDLRARLADVVAAVNGTASVQLLDIRSPDEYQGKIFAPPGVPELSVRAGHIPGAVNMPWGKAVNEDGTFKSVDELKQLYASVGVDGGKPIMTYCRIGERSSHTWFALSKLLGYQVKNYDGSWTEYGNAVGVPINNPSGTVWAAK